MNSTLARILTVLKRATSFRVAVASALTSIGTAYSAGQPVKQVAINQGLLVAAVIVTKCFDDDMMADKSTPTTSGS